jgi:YaiO family outer membrane protein
MPDAPMRQILVVVLLIFPLTGAPAQTGPRFRAEFSPSYNSLNNNYGQWAGADFRLSYRSPRWSPSIGVSTQHRDEGSQQSVGLSSYIFVSDRFYGIVGFSTAPIGDVVLFPRLRMDVAGFMSFPALPGFVLNLGVTHVRFQNSDAQMAGLGAILYRNPLILQGAVRLNRDGAGGDLSAAANFGGQYGAEGKRWVGAGVGAGREAYRMTAVTPFDVRFTSVGASVFLQQWLSKSAGLSMRYDLERKLSEYTRHGLTLGYFVDF